MVDNAPINVVKHVKTTPSSDARLRDRHNPKNTSGEDNATPPVTEKDEAPLDGGYGWVCVACTFLINGHTWGINSSYGVFLSYYLSHNYFPNTSALVYAFVGGLSFSQAVFIAPVATRVIHLFGTRVCLHCGVFFQTLSLIGASFAKEKWQIILAQGICFGWGMGFQFVGSVGVIAQWFLKRRSLANAIATSGSGFGGLIYSLATQSMIDHLGLGWAFRILGIVPFFVNLVAANLLRDRNKAVGSRHKSFDFALLKRPEYVLLQGWSYFSMIGYVTVLFSLPAFAVSIGLSARQGSIIGALLNLGQAIGRPFIGLGSDHYGRLNVAFLCTLACGLCCFAFWIPVQYASSPMGLLSFFAIVGGALAGTFWCTIAPVGAEIVGLKDLPTALSMTWLLMVPPTTVAEPIALELRRQHSSNVYLNAQIFTGMMYIGSALCIWVVRGWKVGEMEEIDRELREDGITQDTLEDIEKTAVTNGDRANTSPSPSGAGWNWRDLVRRMWVSKKV